MASTDLNIVLKLIDEATLGISQVKNKVDTVNSGIKSSFVTVNKSLSTVKDKLSSFANSFKQNWLQITAAITASLFAIRQAVNLITIAAKFEQQELAFQNLAASVGTSADQLIATLKKMSGETLSTAEVMQQASRAIVLGLAPEQLPKLMEIARASARAFGEDVDFMFESIVLGIGRQSRMVLDNLGIIVKAEDAYSNYAQKLNTTVEKLTDMQKRQAFANAAMEAGENIIERVNVQQKTQLENLQSLSAFWQDFKITMGNALITIIQMLSLFTEVLRTGVAASLAKISEALGFVNEKLAIATEFYGKLIEKIPGLNDPLEGITLKLKENAQFSRDFADGMNAGADEFAAAAIQIQQLLSNTTNTIVLDSTRIRKVVEELKNQSRKTTADLVQGALRSVEQLGATLSAAESLGRGFAKAGASIAMSMAVIHTAVGVARALEDYPWPISMVVGGIVAAAGAIQIATIAAQKFHSGGIVGGRGGLASDEIPIIAQSGEGILSRRGISAIGGEQNLNRLNNGESAQSGNSINVNVYYPKMSSRDEVEDLASMLGSQIEHELVYARGI